ncbi:MAG: right-handed parallel beta-helix repeat-containing protein [Planctomycetia bacterium]|nr:right-handed parallel beta-helix repeat-containing protein [Planctomycetia bacterium]
MNRSLFFFASLPLFLLSGLLAEAKETAFYISKTGNDSWSGELADPNSNRTDGPFATFERAQKAIQNLGDSAKRTGPVCVYVRGGIYSLPNGLKFDKSFSGTSACPTIFSAYPQEEVILVGGRTLGQFKKWKESIYRTNVRSQGFEKIPFKQLFVDGKRQISARYPNFDPANPYGGGWAYADGEFIPMYQNIPGENKRIFTIKEKDVRNWKKPSELEVFVFPRYNWWNNICRVESFDVKTRQIRLAQDPSYAVRPTDRYYIQNALEELDAPGEWYLDKETGDLYLWPENAKSEEELNKSAVVAPSVNTIISVDKGTVNLHFQRFTVECAVKSAFSFTQTEKCKVIGCTIRNTGDYSSCAVGFYGGKDNLIAGCDIHDVGSTAIILTGGDVKTLTPARNTADNNYIHHTGVYYKQGVGISLQGVGNRASHNLIHDCPRFGIGFGGNNQIMEYNEIRHVNLETADTGAVYTGGRDWLGSRGTQIRYNYFHDILGYGFEGGKWVSPHFSWGIYLDDNTGGVDVYGNIVVRCLRGLVHLHNGRDNHIWNNIFVDGRAQQFQGSGWTTEHSYWKSHFPTMMTGYNSVAGLPAWKKMRNMDLNPKDAPLPDGTIMSGNKITRNIFYYHQKRDAKSGIEGKYVELRNFNFQANLFDYNLIWNQGDPITTGKMVPGKPIRQIDFPNPGFEDPEKGKIPSFWGWQEHPSNRCNAELDGKDPASGKWSLRLDSEYVPELKRGNTPILCSKGTPLEPGKSYQIRGKFRASLTKAKVQFYVHYFVPGKYWGTGNTAEIGSEWKELVFSFRIPGPGENGYLQGMDLFKISFGNPNREKVSLYMDDISVFELENRNQWESWQELGMDRHSLIADPLFENPDKDDYRLKSNSPVFKLGFKRIPMSRIGPYRSSDRVTWPIVQAEGAREKPLVNTSINP